MTFRETLKRLWYGWCDRHQAYGNQCDDIFNFKISNPCIKCVNEADMKYIENINYEDHKGRENRIEEMKEAILRAKRELDCQK